MRERQREAWEVEHFPEGERAELYELYRRKGYSEEEAEQMLSILTRDSFVSSDWRHKPNQLPYRISFDNGIIVTAEMVDAEVSNC